MKDLKQLIFAVHFLFLYLFIFQEYSYGRVIFADDFSNDAGWSASCGGTISQTNVPSKWTGWMCQPNSSLSIVSGAGQNGKPALRIGYSIGGTSQAMSLFKHLTGNQNTGYDELYVRYKFKFDDNWKSGTNGTDMLYWKWLRLWQNIHPSNQTQWSELNNPNTRYVIANFSGNDWSGNACVNTTWADNASGDSAGGPHFHAWYDKQDPVGLTDGCLKSFSGLTVQKPGSAYPGYFTTYPSGSQSWHIIEYHFKLSTTQSGNGVFEVWFDGVKQKLPIPYGERAYGSSANYLNTMSYNGGMNFLTVFDNMANWSVGWGTTPRYLYLDNVLVSTAYIDTYYTIIDADNDGVPDEDDNCISISNYNQADADSDGRGDMCDPCQMLPPARIAGTIPVYYTTFQSTYDAAVDNDVIELQGIDFTEALNIDLNKSVTLKAGYDCNYTDNTSGSSVIIGDMIISDGELILDSGTLNIQ